jgi:endoglucanase
MGDLGPLALDEYSNKQFHLIDQKSGKSLFSGQLVLRRKLTEPDGGQPNDGPNNNYTAADVWEMDFSSFKTPGHYVIAVDGIGCSFPFTIADDVYRQPFITTARGLYHQRCGIALTADHTKWVRAACHRPETRVFKQTTHRYMDKAFGDGPKGEKFEVTGERRMDMWGGWHDAGDWDRESWHPNVSNELLLTFECAPQKFRDGELNIPESGNGIPDIVDEAKWGVDFYKRIQRPDGGVSVGTFASSWPRSGETSVTDTLDWFVYAEEPLMSYRYAALACRLAWCLKIAGKESLGTPYIESARKAWEWAGKNMREGDEDKVRDARLDAAAALFRATGEDVYQQSFLRDLKIDTPTTLLSIWSQWDQQWGVWTYAMTDRPNINAEVKNRLVQATLHFAEAERIKTAERRAGRYGYNWHVPMWWGAGAIPNNTPLIAAHHLSPTPNYLATQYTTADYMLGGNPLNMVWVRVWVRARRAK